MSAPYDWSKVRRCRKCRRVLAVEMYRDGRAPCLLCETGWEPPPKATDSVTSQQRRASKKWEAANRDKKAAHRAVLHALRQGKLFKKPCERCGSLDVQAHHPSYAREHRLLVRWLCKRHHEDVHL